MPDPIQPTATPPEALTPEPQSPAADQPSADQQEWDEVTKEAYPNLLEEKSDPEALADKPSAEKPATPADPAVPAEPEAPADPNAPPAEPEAEPAAPPTVAEARAIQREIAQDFDAVKRDVALDMFKDLPLELKDADGDPIKSVEDVMKLADPRTGVAFTEEAATAWLLQAQSNLQNSIAEADSQANQITSVNIALKDDADRLQREFGEILKANPDVMKSLWAEFTKTLQVSPSGKVVVNAPVSLYSFVKTALSPYAVAAKAQAEAAAAKEEVEKAKRSQDRASRSDIFGAGKTGNMSKDDEEWAEATKDYYKR